jgi:hypothetical protein
MMIRYQDAQGNPGVMTIEPTEAPTALEALARAGARLLTVGDRPEDESASLLYEVAVNFDPPVPWLDPLMAALLADERGVEPELRPDLADSDYVRLVLEHLRRIHLAAPEACAWVLAQLEHLYWELESARMSVEAWYALLHGGKLVAVATDRYRAMARAPEGLTWMPREDPHGAGREIFRDSTGRYALVEIPNSEGSLLCE